MPGAVAKASNPIMNKVLLLLNQVIILKRFAKFLPAK